MADRPAIVWLRRELRLADHPALAAAARGGRPVLPLYVLDDATSRPPGGASRWWLHGSLAALDAALDGGLVLRRGAAVATVVRLAAEVDAEAVYLTRAHTPQGIADEAALARRLEVRRFGGSLLYEPEDIRTRSGDAYRVFTPFHRACQAAGEPAAPTPAPERLRLARAAGERLDDWALRPGKPDWAAGLRAAWTPGEAAARRQLAAFADAGAAAYAEARDRPDAEGTSRLSPALAFGEISPRQAWHALPGGRGGAAFRRELVWRDFCAHLLFHFPAMADRPFRPEFADFPWREDAAALRAWQRGRTGYPLVDAGMRQLWTTGWMHNRVRMVVASFLTKHLLLPWQAGEAWFWDTLVDADLASNVANWQWVAGCGADAAPYFRIFNPVLQAKKFDPDGAYVRRWLPELASLPDAAVHEPWRHGGAQPIVEHAAARRRALAAFGSIRTGRASPAASAPGG